MSQHSSARDPASGRDTASLRTTCWFPLLAIHQKMEPAGKPSRMLMAGQKQGRQEQVYLREPRSQCSVAGVDSPG